MSQKTIADPPPFGHASQAFSYKEFWDAELDKIPSIKNN